jgi:hypothetical protein
VDIVLGDLEEHTSLGVEGVKRDLQVGTVEKFEFQFMVHSRVVVACPVDSWTDDIHCFTYMGLTYADLDLLQIAADVFLSNLLFQKVGLVVYSVDWHHVMDHLVLGDLKEKDLVVGLRERVYRRVDVKTLVFEYFPYVYCFILHDIPSFSKLSVFS